jgi:hypothetical protein
MFTAQDLGVSLLPYCYYLYHTCYGFYSPCGYCSYGFTQCYFQYPTIHCPLAPYTVPKVQQGPVCAGLASIPAPVAPCDPVEGLRALRQQLEVALAGVRAQEEELRRQRAAGAGEEGR